jgi:maleylpyruvate isomerase
VTSDAPETTVQLDTVAEATTRLLDTVRGLGEADVTEPSLLPGWTRGHVLAHLARNADSLVNLLLWARTGIETPQYPSQFIRDADIEAGAPRPLAEQLTDNETAARRWLSLAQTMPPAAWEAIVRTRQGRPIAATEVLWMRLQEVEIHHVDLHPSDTNVTGTIGTAARSHTITGPAHALLAWLLGRSIGADLTGDLPALPAWK